LSHEGNRVRNAVGDVLIAGMDGPFNAVDGLLADVDIHPRERDAAFAEGDIPIWRLAGVGLPPRLPSWMFETSRKIVSLPCRKTRYSVEYDRMSALRLVGMEAGKRLACCMWSRFVI
jgi:hypothetical protein